jgi:hypothetical protein
VNEMGLLCVRSGMTDDGGHYYDFGAAGQVKYRQEIRAPFGFDCFDRDEKFFFVG